MPSLLVIVGIGKAVADASEAPAGSGLLSIVMVARAAGKFSKAVIAGAE